MTLFRPNTFTQTFFEVLILAHSKKKIINFLLDISFIPYILIDISFKNKKEKKGKESFNKKKVLGYLYKWTMHPKRKKTEL